MVPPDFQPLETQSIEVITSASRSPAFARMVDLPKMIDCRRTIRSTGAAGNNCDGRIPLRVGCPSWTPMCRGHVRHGPSKPSHHFLRAHGNKIRSFDFLKALTGQDCASDVRQYYGSCVREQAGEMVSRSLCLLAMELWEL